MKNSMGEQIIRFRNPDRNEVSVEQKLDEFIVILNQSDLDSQTIGRLQSKVNDALDRVKDEDKFKAFQKLDESLTSRFEMAENLESLLSTYQVDSKASRRYLFGEKLLKFVLILTSLVLITLGFAMIILPAPPEFEMFTIIYFSLDDGFTLMDLIALLIVLSGVYLFIRSVIRTNNNSAD